MDSEKAVADHLIREKTRPLVCRSRRSPPKCLLAGWLVLCLGLAHTETVRAQSAESHTYAVIVTGLGGDPEYEKLIQGWGKDLYAALKRSNFGEGRLFWLAAKKQEEVYAESRQQEIVGLLEALAARIRPEDVFQLFLMGHGSYDEYDYRFSIPGSDLTASQWGELLGRVRATRQVVVNMTSASGASLAPLRKKGRVVITSTSVGRERNFSVFARYFLAALQDPASDTDKNEEISVLEAYRYATREVTRHYESLKRLATEHALLEDRGDSEGAREATPATGQGLLASTIPLLRLAGSQAILDTPEARELRAQKRRLEEGIEDLKYRKASLDTAEYYQQLEQWLVQLAETQQRLDELEKE